MISRGWLVLATVIYMAKGLYLLTVSTESAIQQTALSAEWTNLYLLVISIILIGISLSGKKNQ